MGRAASLLALPLALLAAGCGARTTSPVVELRAGNTPAPVDKEAGAVDTILIWGQEAGKQGEGDPPPVTYRIDGSDPHGSVLGSEPGIVIAARGGEWTFTTTEIEVPTEPCDGSMGVANDQPAGDGKATRAELVLKGGSERQAVITPDTPKVNDLQHSVTLLGSVGPHLFLHETMYMYACGAHGNTVASFSAWDAQEGKAFSALGEVPDVDALKAEGQRVLNETEDQDYAREEKPDLVELRPTYDARGKLGLMALLPRGTCYTCSDGEWGSYTRSAQVKTSLPRLAPYVEAPPAVRVFLSAHPGFTMHGWSRR
jgi:hypothetical protein